MDRRFLLAMMLFIAIIVVPSMIFKRPPSTAVGVDSIAPVTPAPPSISAERPEPADAVAPPPDDSVTPSVQDTMPAAEDIVTAQSPLYTFGVSTRGARLVSATLTSFRSMSPGDDPGPLELLRPESDFLGLRLLRGQDTLYFDRWMFTTPSVGTTLDVSTAATPVSTAMAAAHIKILTVATARSTLMRIPSWPVRASLPETTAPVLGGTMLLTMPPAVRRWAAVNVTRTLWLLT